MSYLKIEIFFLNCLLRVIMIMVPTSRVTIDSYNFRVKFGVPLDQVCCIHDDIPGPLLILILKINKEGPYKKDIFRAPGHQSNMKKLIHFLQVSDLTIVKLSITNSSNLVNLSN